MDVPLKPLIVGVVEMVKAEELKLFIVTDMPAARTVELIAGMVTVSDDPFMFTWPPMSVDAIEWPLVNVLSGDDVAS